METPPAFPPEVWERTPPEAPASIQALAACLETLASLVPTLQEQVRTVQEQLHQTSPHASRPPASAPPPYERPQRRRSDRRRGGPPGPPGHPRPLSPVEEVDEGVGIKPEQGAHCQASVSEDEPQPWRQHGSESPPLRPVRRLRSQPLSSASPLRTKPES